MSPFSVCVYGTFSVKLDHSRTKMAIYKYARIEGPVNVDRKTSGGALLGLGLVLYYQSNFYGKEETLSYCLVQFSLFFICCRVDRQTSYDSDIHH